MQIKSNLFNITPSQPFALTLVAGLISRLPDTYQDALILLPNRRAVTYLRTAWLNHTNGTASLLPRIEPIGDVDEDRLFFEADFDVSTASIKPAISKLSRSLILARLIQPLWHERLSLERALTLADDLSQLIDTFHTHSLPAEKLALLVTDDLAEHWQITRQFLQHIIGMIWPDYLAKNNLIDPSLRQRLLLEQRAETWAKNAPNYPIIAAGSTGSIPATAKLLRCIAALPQGMVVLPGLDTFISDEAWQHVAEGHPQYHLKQLLITTQTPRIAVEQWHGQGQVVQDRLVSTIMLPPEHLQEWQHFSAHHPQGLDTIDIFKADSIEEEARVCALILRETLEHQAMGKTALLVTPDRKLAARIQALMKRFSVVIDDSAGTTLSATALGHFLLYTAYLLQNPLSPKHLITALTHEMVHNPVSWGLDTPFKDYVLALDLSLRGTAKSVDLATLDPFFASLFDTEKPGHLSGFLHQHLRLAENLSGGADKLWQGETGKVAAALMTQLLDTSTLDDTGITLDDYIDFLKRVLQKTTVRHSNTTHPNIHILGQIEARFIHADTLILAGLNEGIWPSEQLSGAWLSRPMRKLAGLPALETQISLAAHDFAQALASSHVVLTYASQRDGAPVLASRFVERILACAAIGQDTKPLERGMAHLSNARLLDTPQRSVKSAARPYPCPPVSARPKRLSVTRVATLFDDPYSIYAAKILRLQPLLPLEAPLSAADLGLMMHAILEETAQARSVQDVHSIMQRHMAAVDDGDIHIESAYISQFADDIFNFELNRRLTGRFFGAEVSGSFDLTDIPNNTAFTLFGRADRIEFLTNGQLAIIDFKKSKAASDSKINGLDMPQLALLGLIAKQGGFDKIPAQCVVGELSYVAVTDRNAPMKITSFKDPEESIKRIDDILKTHIRYFADPHVGYVCLPRGWKPARDYDYAQLSRMQEWLGGE